MSCKWDILTAYFVGIVSIPLAALLITFKRYMVKRRDERIERVGGRL